MMTPQEHFSSLFSHFSYLCCHRFEADPESSQKKRENGRTSLTAGGGERERILNDGGDERASIATDKRLRLASTPAAMATLSDLKEVKEALDAGLVSQAEFDKVKRDYLRGKEECQKLELQAKKEALEANKEFQKREAEADLRAYALESIVKHGSSIMSEEQKVDLVRDYVRMSGLDCAAEKDARASKRQRLSAEKRGASPPQLPTPPRTSPAPAVPPPADAPAPVVANQATAPAPWRSKRVRSKSAIMKEIEAAAADSEDSRKWTVEDDAALVAALRAGQKANTIRIGGRPAGAGQAHLSWAKANGLCTPALREYLEETCPEYVYKPSRVCPPWSEEEDQTFIQAHKEGKMIKEIAAMLPGRTENAVHTRLSDAKRGKAGSAALRAYVAECAPEIRSPWSVEEDQIFIQAHKKGKIFQEITAMLPGRTECAVEHRWSDAKKGKAGTAALRAYAAEYRKNK